uniref:Accessory gland protein Acp29AB-like n=1 Tax=Drosophila rhopaloa TaxID=1041015 RepID=A0A6P4ESB3_DRORH
MHQIVIILAVACQLAYGFAIPDSSVPEIPRLSKEHMGQLAGVCMLTLDLMVKKTASDHLSPPNQIEGERKRSVSLENFEKMGDRYFYIEQQHKRNWFAAVRACRDMGAQLAVIENQAEMNSIYEKQTLGRYWLDISDLVKRGEFSSLTTGLKAPFINWRSDQPDNLSNSKHCVNMFGPLMYNDNCETEHYFVCQA